ncbi:Pre-rRNA-processing protein fhl1 [Orbilia brochopaga]|uniref:Pre-rRNA-processing protein fhl1 n=1 Tax=Orbilia brochopaga TaxID=3140254 RepID=A0AAV9U6M9_9PEZI
MADVETKRVDGPVVEQTITPRPSPDEAIISTGDDTATSAAAAIATIAAAAHETGDEKNSNVVAIPDGIVVTTAEPIVAHDKTKDATTHGANGTTSPATSPSTVNNRDDDYSDVKMEERVIKKSESTEPFFKREDGGDGKPPVKREEASTSSEGDSHSNPNGMELVKGFDESLNIPTIDVAPAPWESTLSAGELMQEVEGGVWHPTHPKDGINPRIEAFAKLEFDHGQDFYLGCLNIVLGRHDKNPAKAARIQRRRSTGLNLDAATADEIKVPVLVPPELPSPSVSRRHVRVMYNYETAAWEATALCPNGFRRSRSGKSRLYRNGETCLLSNTDIVTFGNITFTFYLPQDESEGQDEEDRDGLYDQEDEEITPRARVRKAHAVDSEHESDDGDDEDEGSDIDSREPSNDITLPTPGGNAGADDASLMPPPPVKRGRGRPPKNGISVREQKLLKRQAQEEFIANGGDVSNLDMSKYGNLPVEQLFAKEGEKMQMAMEKEKLRQRKAAEKEARDSMKKAIKDSKPPKTTKERKRKRSKSPPPREEDYSAEQLLKPTIPYTVMIWEAIEASEKKALTLPEIYKSLEESYPYFKVKAETTGWQSSVRHNLRGSGESGSALFRRGEKSGKGYIWEIIEGADIEKERRKKRTGTSSSVPSAHAVPSSGNWGQTAGPSSSQMAHQNSLNQQYQPQPMSGVQAFTPRQGVQYVQAGNQVTAPSASPTPVPTAVPNGQSHTSPTTSSRPLENHSTTAPRPAAPAAVPPPPSWNPSQTRTASTSISTNGNSHTPLTPHSIPNGAVTHFQQPVHQSHVAAAGPAQAPTAGSLISSALGNIPPPPSATSKPPSTIGDDQNSTTSTQGRAPDSENRAKSLLNDPQFRVTMQRFMNKYAGTDINSPEVLREMWADYVASGGKRPSTSSTITSKATTPKVPGAKVPGTVVPHTQSQEAQPPRNPVAPDTPNSNGVPVTPARTAATSASSSTPTPTPIKTPTVQPGQVKPGTPATLPPRATSLLKGLPMDAKKRAELLQMLKLAKEKKAAESKGSPVTGIKRPAEADVATAPAAKRTALEGQP